MKQLVPLGALLVSIAVAHAQSTPTINFQPGAVITLPAGALPSALAVSDFNQDSRNDVAVCQRGLGSVGVYLQSTGGNFPNPAVATYAVGLGPTGLVAVGLSQQLVRGAIDRGAIDLVAVSPVSSYFTLLTNNENGSGTFTPVVNTGSDNGFGSSDPSANPQLTVANLDVNDKPDFIYTYDPPASTINAGVFWRELETSSRLAFGFRSFHRPGYRPSSMDLADFDRDGLTDLIMTNPTGNEFTVVIAGRSNGAPNWALPSSTSFRLPSGGLRPIHVAAADVNLDFLPDVVLAHEGSSDITLFLNLNNYQFGAQASYPLSGAPRRVLLADLNRDRFPEMLVLTANNQLQIFQHTTAAGASRYGTPITLATGPDPTTMQLADMDGDSKLDVVVGCTGDNTVRVYLNRAALATRPKQLTGVSVYPNPAINQLTIQRSTMRSPLTATLLDAMGREVRRTEMAASATSITVADLPRGIYVLRLSAKEGMMSQRIVVQ